ncbi:MAG: hypothetical protein RJA98_1777 [Pseudomonadota bacterium]|jgi:peptidoglycan L-alanyl-D-glutamate endopeptidase CwlK
MMWLAVIAYFLLACAVAAWLLLPGLRESVAARLGRAATRARHRQARARSAATLRARHGWMQAGGAVQGGQRWVGRHALGLSVAALLLVLPPAVVYLLRGAHTAADFDGSEAPPPDAVVAALLQGEQLVPPPPLPPEVFSTAEVEQVRPQLATADRRWERMDAEFQQRLLLVYRIMREEHGYEMALLEGYRSPERQTLLASLGANVTNAGAWQSYHQYGMAADSAFIRHGKLVISEREPWAMRGYELYGEVAQRVGLTWGGRWKNADLGHIELRRPGTIRPKVGA